MYSLFHRLACVFRNQHLLWFSFTESHIFSPFYPTQNPLFPNGSSGPAQIVEWGGGGGIGLRSSLPAK